MGGHFKKIMILMVLVVYGIFAQYTEYLINGGPDYYTCFETCSIPWYTP